MKVKTIEIDPKEIKLLDLNARYMKHEEFQQLVNNIKRDGQLTSTPFLCKDKDGKWLCLSGNHRMQAAISAGLEKILCLSTEDELTQDQKTAIQLSHNSLCGEDDPATLKILYESIMDAELKKYSGLDDETLEMLDKFASTSISEANLEFKTLSVVFLPDELETAMKVIDKARDASKSADKTWLAKNDEYDRWLDAQEAAMSSYGVSNVATAMDIILKVFTKNITQLQDGYKNDTSKTWVHLETVIGRRKIPSDLARKLSSILQKMESRGEIKKDELWKGLDKLCDAYLNGGE